MLCSVDLLLPGEEVPRMFCGEFSLLERFSPPPLAVLLLLTSEKQEVADGASSEGKC